MNETMNFIYIYIYIYKPEKTNVMILIGTFVNGNTLSSVGEL